MALTADRINVLLEANNQQFDQAAKSSATTFEQSSARIKTSAVGMEKTVVGATAGATRGLNQMRTASTNLGFQVQDITSQLAIGISPFVVLGQQAGQTASAIAGMGGTAGRIATFFAGPWGSALFAAITVLGLMATKNEEVAEKKRATGDAARNLNDAIEDLEAATGRSNSTTDRAIRLSSDLALAFELEEKNALIAAQGNLDLARARIAAFKNVGSGGLGVGTAIAQIGELVFGGDEAEALAEIERISKSIERSAVARSKGIRDTIAREVRGSLDPVVAAQTAYDAIKEQIDEAFDNGRLTGEEYAGELRKIEVSLTAAKDAAGNYSKALREQRQAEKEAIREAEDATRAYYQTVNAANAALDTLSKNATDDFDKRMSEFNAIMQKLPTPQGGASTLEDRTAEIDQRRQQQFEKTTEAITEAYNTEKALLGDLASGLTGAIDGANSFGDALVNAFRRAALAQLEAGIGKALGGGLNFIKDFLSPSAASLRAAPGNAMGGSYTAQTARGGDSSLAVLRVNNGERIDVSPSNKRAMNRGGGTTVIQPITLDLKGAVVTRELLAQVNQIAGNRAREAASASFRAGMAATPGALSQMQTLGNGPA